MKSQKKIIKHRQESKAQDRALRSKVDSEASKDLTELEKEMFSIKITDLEEKLNRKRQVCAFLEEEKQFFEAEYESKKILKKESMALLDKAYENFYLELLLLRNELSRMRTEKTFKRRENVPVTKRVERLTNLERKLKQKLEESEKNIEDISLLKSKLSELQGQIASKSDDFKSNISNLDLEFRSFVKRLQDKMKDIAERRIEDKSLKLQLLPLPYQALFHSGMLGSIWFESILETCEHLVRQNAAMNGDMEQLIMEYKEICEASSKDFSAIVISTQAKMLLNKIYGNVEDAEKKKRVVFDNRNEFDNQMKYLLQLNHLSIHLKKNIDYLQNKVETLERKIKERESIADTCEENFHLQQIISQAKNILTHEL